jgi:hypothetical protein
MASLHTVALIALTLAVAGGADAPRGQGQHDRTIAATVTLSGGGKPGGLTIVNHGASAQWVARALTVEWRDGETWRPITTRLDLIAACDLRFPRRTAAVRLLPAQSVSVVPWTGFSCRGQCPTSCRMNIYHGAGRFRIVATLLPSNARVIGPVFRMPDRPQPEVDQPITLTEIEAAARQPRRGDNDP